MKFRCGRLWHKYRQWRSDRYHAKLEWHDHFCLFPAKVGWEDCRWLETVKRRLVRKEGYDDYWEEWEYHA